jgi:protein-tyrosine phosphatase
MVGNWGNIGPISDFAVDGLKVRGVPINGDHRYPLALTQSDLVNSDLVVAVKEAEHRQLMEEQFPDWSEGTEYWHVDDLDCATPEEALPRLEAEVRALITRLENAVRANSPSS